MATDMAANDDVVVGDACAPNKSRTAVECRFRVSDANRNAALKSMGEEGEEGNASCERTIIRCFGAVLGFRKRHPDPHSTP